MLLSQLEIIGFKSFAKRTKLEFHPGVTGIVGPNGCGKSNLVDAVRWVMGEQKGSILRSEKMEQVIFNGTQNRKPFGMAEVNLTMLNDNGLLPSEYSEVTVSRRLYRNGESEYLLNRKKCRLKDIIDLFLDTGLGADSYGIIEPSLINRVLTENPEERRILFEEAAGIAKYKLRVRTAERRLEIVNENLDRINDILSEVEKNVQRLKRQYRQAKKYEILRAKLEEWGTLLLAIERSELLDQLRLADRQYAEKQVRLSDLEADFQRLEVDMQQLDANLNQGEVNLQAIRTAWEKLREETVQAANRRLLLEEKELNWRSEKERLLEAGERSRQHSAYLQERSAALVKAIEDLQKLTASAEAAVRQAAEEHSTAESSLKSAQEETGRCEKDAEELKNRIETIEREISLHQFKIASHYERKRDLEQELIQIEKKLEEGKLKKRDVTSGQEQAEKNLRQIDLQLEALEQQAADLKQRLKQKEILHSEQKIASERLKSELQFLQSLIDSGGGLPQGAVYLKQNKIPGIIDSLGNLLEVPSQYAPALETALGEAAHYLAVESAEQAESALDILRRESKGKVTLAPLDFIPSFISTEEPKLSGVLGTADRLIGCEDRYRPLFSALLSKVLVVKSWKEAREVHSSARWDGLIVTLDGEALGKFTFLGGRSKEHYPAVGRRKQVEDTAALRRQLEEEISALEKEILHYNDELAQAEKSQSGKQIERNSISLKIAALASELAAVDAEKNSWKERTANIAQDLLKLNSEENAARNELQEYSAQAKSLQDSYNLKQRDLHTKRERLQQLRTGAETVKEELHRRQLQLSEKQGELSKLQTESALAKNRLQEIAQEDASRLRIIQEIEQKLTQTAVDKLNITQSAAQVSAEKEKCKEALIKAESEQNEIKRQRVQIDKQLKEKAGVIDPLRSEKSAIELTIAELKLKISAKEDSASEKYGIDLDAVEVPPDYDKAKIAVESAKIKSRLDSIGPVNLLALEEYGSQNQRLQFLQTEQSDIVYSKEELLDTISQTNAEARARFRKVFNKVAEYFSLLFNDLFEGGNGELSLGAGDILDAPIEIQANPGGKKLTNMDQLSGGEKTLTALALIFSLYQVKPSPFCILDEVDAPLDDANVERFLKLIKRFTPQTQFILITHNKITMEACDYLFGVTMEEDGLSKLVSVDLKTTYQMTEAL